MGCTRSGTFSRRTPSRTNRIRNSAPASIRSSPTAMVGRTKSCCAIPGRARNSYSTTTPTGSSAKPLASIPERCGASSRHRPSDDWSNIARRAIVVVLAIAANPAAAAIVEVHLKDQNFNPQTVSAKPGDTIVFHNDDNVLHSVLLPANEALLASHFIEPHKGYEVVIPSATDPGDYELVCTVHINMKGTLQIVAQ